MSLIFIVLDDLRFANGLESISRGQNEDGSVPYQQQASLLQSVKSPFEFDPSVPVGGIIGDYEDADDSVPGLSLCTAPGIDYGGKTFYYICYRSTAQQQSESQNEENYASAERYVKAGEWKDRTMQKLLELLKAAAAEK